MKKLTEKDVTFTLEALPEDMEVRGNLIASGDNEFDKKAEDKVLKELDWNIWAWCLVKVTAEFEGLKGVAYLGGCSYESEANFRNDAYYTDMKGEALEELQHKFDKLQSRSEELQEKNGGK